MKTLVITIGIAVFVCAPAQAFPREITPVPVADKSCPLTLHSARVIDAGGSTFQIAYSIGNPRKKTADALVVAAAAVDANGNVRALQTRAAPQRLTSRTTAEYVVEFQRIELEPDEHLVVGIQGVIWDKQRAWQGALPLAKTPEGLQAAPSATRQPRQ